MRFLTSFGMTAQKRGQTRRGLQVPVNIACSVIAVPVSVVIMNRYLEGFAYRVPLHIWVFAMSLLAVLAITIAVVTLRSLRAATVNPVKSLRTE